MLSQCNSGPGAESFITILQKSINLKLMICLFVPPQMLSGPECFLAEIAWNGDPLQVVGLNVITNVPGVTFLSKNIANGCCCQLFSTLNLVVYFIRISSDIFLVKTRS